MIQHPAAAALLLRQAGSLWRAAAQSAANASTGCRASLQAVQGVHVMAQEPLTQPAAGTTSAARRDRKDASTSGRSSEASWRGETKRSWQPQPLSSRRNSNNTRPNALPAAAAHTQQQRQQQQQQQQQAHKLQYEAAVEQLEAAIRAKDLSRIAEHFQPRAIQTAPDGGAALLHALLLGATEAADAALTRAILLLMKQQNITLNEELYRNALNLFSKHTGSHQQALEAIETCMPRTLLPDSHGQPFQQSAAPHAVDGSNYAAVAGEDGNGAQQWTRLRQLAASGNLQAVQACWRQLSSSCDGSSEAALAAHSRLLSALHSMLHSRVGAQALAAPSMEALRGVVRSYVQCLVDRSAELQGWQQAQQQQPSGWELLEAAGHQRQQGQQQQQPKPKQQRKQQGKQQQQQQQQQQKQQQQQQQQHQQQQQQQQWLQLPMQAAGAASAWGTAPYHALASSSPSTPSVWHNASSSNSSSTSSSSLIADAPGPAAWVPAQLPHGLLARATPAEQELVCRCVTKAMHLAGELVDGQGMQQLLALRTALRLQPHADMYHPLMDLALWQGAAPETLEDMLSEMVAYGLMPNAAHYEELLECYAAHGDTAAAEAVLDRMANLGLVPTLRTYNRLLHGLAVSADVNAAQRAYDRMLAAGLTPDVHTMARLFKVVRYYAKHVRLECARKVGEAETRGQQRQQLGKRSARFAGAYRKLVAWQEDMVALRLQHNAVSLQHLVKALERLNAVADCIELAGVYEKLRPGDWAPHRAALHVSGRHRSMQAVSYAQQLVLKLGDSNALQGHHDTVPLAASQYWLLRDKAALDEGLAGTAKKKSSNKGSTSGDSTSSSSSVSASNSSNSSNSSSNSSSSNSSSSNSSSSSIASSGSTRGKADGHSNTAKQKFSLRTYCTLSMWEEALQMLDSMLAEPKAAQQQLDAEQVSSSSSANSSSSTSSAEDSTGPSAAAKQAVRRRTNRSPKQLIEARGTAAQLRHPGVPVQHASGYGAETDSVWHVVFRNLITRDAPDTIVTEFASRMAPQQLHRFAVMYGMRRHPSSGGYTLRRVTADDDSTAESGDADASSDGVSGGDDLVEGLEFLDEEDDEVELGWGPPVPAKAAATAAASLVEEGRGRRLLFEEALTPAV